jgi:hypothetical protein
VDIDDGHGVPPCGTDLVGPLPSAVLRATTRGHGMYRCYLFVSRAVRRHR